MQHLTEKESNTVNFKKPPSREKLISRLSEYAKILKKNRANTSDMTDLTLFGSIEAWRALDVLLQHINNMGYFV